jgi:hypothetical protein
VDIALRPHSSRPILDNPPLRTFWFSGRARCEGVDTHSVDGIPVRIYSPAKSVADSFKYRRKIGLDTALEALRLYHQSGDFLVEELMNYARICRAEKILRPYLEAIWCGGGRGITDIMKE